MKVHPVAALFPLIEGEEFDALVADIKANGLREPIDLTADGKTLIEGRNRLAACEKAGVKPTFRKLQKRLSDHQIIEFIISKNIHRRHLNAGQRAMLMLAIEPALAAAKERQRLSKGPGKKGKANSPYLKQPQVRDQIAKQGKVSGNTVTRAKKVKNSNPRLAEQVIAGALSLNDAHKQVRDAERSAPKEAPLSKTLTTIVNHKGKEFSYPLPKGPAHFNRQTTEQVSWAAWTWNPVTGCLHNCSYCYARELSHRPSYSATYPRKFEPVFHPERLDAPANTKVPDDAAKDSRLKRVFAVSMGDLYGKWVPDEWIDKVHASCIANPQWDYLMLTKFPQRYVGLQWHDR